MSFYENTFILRQDLSTSDVERIAGEFAATVKDAGGKVVKTEMWGLRDLAFKIHKSKKGHYVHMGIDAKADAIKELDRKLGLSEDVIRSLTLRVDSISKEPAKLNDNKDSE